MSSGQSNFLDVEATCKVLQRVSLQFAEGSEESEAISVAATALISQATQVSNREFELFFACRKESHDTDEMRTEWLAKNPGAAIGKIVIIGAKLHVVTLDYDGQLHLVPIRPIS